MYYYLFYLLNGAGIFLCVLGATRLLKALVSDRVGVGDRILIVLAVAVAVLTIAVGITNIVMVL